MQDLNISIWLRLIKKERLFGAIPLEVKKIIKVIMFNRLKTVVTLLSEKTNENLVLLKTDSDGKKVWHQIYEFGKYASCVHPTQDGGYIIAGTELFKTDEKGSVEWVRDFKVLLDDVLQTNDGGFIMIGGNSLIKTDDFGLLQNQQSPAANRF